MMLRAAFRPVTRALAQQPLPQQSLLSLGLVGVNHANRGFATKTKHEDPSLEGRYATALFTAAKSNLDKVYADMTQIRTFMEESNDFKLFVETPGVNPQQKNAVMDNLAQKYGYSPVTTNFLKVLVENRRLTNLGKMIASFEEFYRAEKGQVLCKVMSATELSAAQKTQVQTALQTRAEKGSKLILEYEVNPALLGGLTVKMADQVFDFSVQSKLDRLQAQLLSPVM